jgi:hypothetical protein
MLLEAWPAEAATGLRARDTHQELLELCGEVVGEGGDVEVPDHEHEDHDGKREGVGGLERDVITHHQRSSAGWR